MSGNIPLLEHTMRMALLVHVCTHTSYRTHDSGVLDWEKLFPHPKLDVDTGEPLRTDSEQLYIMR